MSLFLTKWFNELKDFIGGLFDAAAKAWHKTEPEIQQALIQGSSIINIVRNALDVVPAEVYSLIQKAFPTLSEDKLKTALETLAGVFQIKVEDSLPDTLGNIQAYLKEHAASGDTLADGILSTSAQILSIAFAPDQTVMAKINLLIEYVYREFVKG